MRNLKLILEIWAVTKLLLRNSILFQAECTYPVFYLLSRIFVVQLKTL